MTHRSVNWIIWACIAAILIIVVSCKKPSPPVPPSAPKVVASVGGFMHNNMGPLDTMARAEGLEVATFGEWNAYLADLYGYMTANPGKTWIVMGDSWGCDRVCRDAGKYEFEHPGSVRLVILVSPVCMAIGKSTVYPPTGVKCVVFREEHPMGTVPAAVYGAHDEVYVPGSNHVDIVARSEVVERTRDELREAIK